MQSPEQVFSSKKLVILRPVWPIQPAHSTPLPLVDEDYDVDPTQ